MANTRFKADHGIVATGNSEFYHIVNVYANAYFQNDLFIVSGNLVVNGTLIYANVTVDAGGIIPASDQEPLGNTTNRFDVFAYNVDVYGSVEPGANSVTLGTASKRFDGFFEDLNVANVVTVGTATINSTMFSGSSNNASSVGGATANGFLVRTGSGTATSRTIAVANGLSISNANGVSGNPTISFTFGSGFLANTTGLYVNASAISVGTLPLNRGGTGSATQQDAINALLPSQTGNGGKALTTDGSNPSWSSVVGYTGSKGDIGSTGYTGSQGNLGYTGSQGSQGVIGYTGSQGDIGYTGSLGSTGYTGSVGKGLVYALIFG